MAERFFDDFKRFFLRGLAAMLPAILTLMIIVYVLKFIDENIGSHIDVAVQWAVVRAVSLSQHTTRAEAHVLVRSFWEEWRLHWVSFLLAFVLIYVFGRFVASLLGRALWRVIEKGFFRLPVVRQIYPSVKQVTDFLLAERKMEFSRVVAVEYPRKGIWSLGLVTHEGMRTLQEAIGEDLATVFVPSSPTPVTGYTITVRREEIIDLPISIDEALRFIVSGGVILPPGQVLSEAELGEVRRGLFPPRPRELEEPQEKEITA